MDPIQQRYHFEKQILSTVNGTLHEGKDLSLQRQVFLYHIRANRQTTHDEIKRLIGSVSHFSSPSFFHIMDLDESEDGVYAVLEHRTGSSLQHLLHSPSLSLTVPQALNLIVNLGETLQDALEQRVRGFSITAENIWLDQDQLMIINYWAEGDRQQRGVLGLVHLLCQLLLQTADLPDDADSLEQELTLSIELYFPEKKESLLKLIKRVLKGHESLSSFLLELQSLIQDKAPITDKESQAVKNHPLEDIPEKAKRLWPFTKRITLASGMVLLFSLGIVTYIQLLSHQSVPASVPSNIPKNVSANETVAALPPIEIEATPLPSSEHTIQVPDLDGLSKEEAEKLALSYGLHYKYFVEYHDQQEGLVFKQEPEAGTEVPKGGYLTFWISKGSAPQ